MLYLEYDYFLWMHIIRSEDFCECLHWWKNINIHLLVEKLIDIHFCLQEWSNVPPDLADRSIVCCKGLQTACEPPSHLTPVPHLLHSHIGMLPVVIIISLYTSHAKIVLSVLGSVNLMQLVMWYPFACLFVIQNPSYLPVIVSCSSC